MSIQIRTEKLRAKLAKMAQQAKNAEQAVAIGVFKAALIARNDMIGRILKGPKSGIIYHRKGKGTRARNSRTGGAGVDHQASAPGEAPANDTGHLARSINVVAGAPGKVSTSIVNINAEYAQMLEYGTTHIEPRPFVRPSLEDNKLLMSETIKAEVVKALKEEP